MLRLIAVALAALVAAGQPLLAQNLSPDRQICFDSQVVQSRLDERIAGCSRIIGESDLSPQLRAVARLHRALAYTQTTNKSPNKETMDRAIADLSEAIQMTPDDRSMQRRAFEMRAGLYFHNGDYDRAIEDYTVLIGLDPESATAYEYRGFAYATKGLHERALPDYAEAIRRAPKTARVYNQRAWSYLLSGKPAEGLPDANEALRLDANDAASHVTRGLINRALGRAVESAEDLRKALALDPANEGIRQELRLAEASQQTALAGEGKDKEQLKAEIRKAQEGGKAAEQRLEDLDTTDSRVAMAPTKEASPSMEPGLPQLNPAKLARDLQIELKRVGCLDGEADGDWGKQSKKALKEFVRHAKLSIASDEPSEDALAAAAAMKARTCPIECSDDEKLVDGRCVAKQRKVHREPAVEGRREARRYRAEPSYRAEPRYRAEPSSSGGGSGGLKLCNVGGRQMAVCN